MNDSAVLLIDCPDRKGLVARVSGLLYEHGANILHADQHQDHDQGLFFMRVEFTVNGGDESAAMEPAEPQNSSKRLPTDEALFAGAQAASSETNPDLAAFRAAFAPLAAGLNMRWKLTSSARRPRVALFCSQYLHCMADLLHRWRTGELGCEIPVIVSNHRAVEDLAVFYGIPFEHTPVLPAVVKIFLLRPGGGSYCRSDLHPPYIPPFRP